MLTVQTMIGTVEADRKNGSNHSMYHGYTTGPHKSDAAIGQAKASADASFDLLLIQIAVIKPANTASAAKSWGAAARSSIVKTGSLNRNLCT